MGELYHFHQEAPGPRGTWEQAHSNAMGIFKPQASPGWPQGVGLLCGQ